MVQLRRPPPRDYFGADGPPRRQPARDYMAGERLEPPPPRSTRNGDAANGLNAENGALPENGAALESGAAAPHGQSGNGRVLALAPPDHGTPAVVAPPDNGQVAAATTLANGLVAAPAADGAMAPPRPPVAVGGWSRTFDSMRLTAFRWMFLAMLGQFAAMNMQMLVSGYLVFDLTGSFAALGVISLASAIPMFLLSPVGGVLADRMSRKLVLQTGQFMNAGIAASVAVLLFTDMLRVEHLFVSATLQGGVWALMLPARQAVIPDVVGEERLMNAVALNTAGMNFMRLVAPGIGGFMIALVGAEWVYVMMTSSFLFAIVMLIPMRTPFARSGVAAPASRGRGRGRGSMKDLIGGVRYIKEHRNVQAILIANFVIVLFSMPYMMLLPGFVADVLDGGPDQLGILQSITGVGALAGSLAVASMANRGRGKMLLWSSLLLGVALIAFTISQSFWITALIMVPIGIGQAGRMSLSMVLVQAYTEDAYRGRVMSVYMMEFGLVSFGVFAVGLLASVVGIQIAIGGTAVALIVTMVLSLLFYSRLRDLE